MTRSRRILVIGAAALAVIVVGVAAAALLIPGERVAAAVAARAEALLGQRVRMADVGLRFLPMPGVRISGVVVGGTADDDALATADAVELRARLLPLLRGRVIIGSLALDRPRILVVVDSAGGTNIPVLGPDEVDTSAGTGPRDITFAVDRLTVTDGGITFRDARDGSEVRLAGWDQRLRIRGDVRGGRLGEIELGGWLEVDDIDATLPRVVLPVRDLALRVTHDATLDRTTDRLTLRALDVTAGGITLVGAGTLDSASSATGRSAELSLLAEGFDAGRLLELLPDSVRPRLTLPGGRPLRPVGTASVRLEIDGPLTPGALPRFDGALSLAGAGIESDDEALASDVRGEMVFSADSAVLRAGGTLLGERFTMAVAVREPAAPSAVVAFNGSADLARLAPLGLVPDTLSVSGSIRASLQALLPTTDLAAARVAGTVDLGAVRVLGGTVPLTVSSGKLTFAGQRIIVDPLALRLGEEGRVDVRAEVDGWIRALADSTAAPPGIAAEVMAGALDLDRLLGPPEGEYPALLFARLQDRPLDDGRTAAEAAVAAHMRVPALPKVEAEARIRIDRLVRNATAYDNVDATVRITPDSIQVLAASFGFMGGTVRGNGTLVPLALDSTGAAERARLTATYALANVGAAPFFDRLTPFRDHLAGELSMAGTLAMELDQHALPDRASVSSDGTAAVSQGRLAGWRVLEAASQRLGLTALDTVRFRDWAGTFRIVGPLVTLDETALDGPEISARAAGSFDFGGRLDLGATAYLSRELAARAGAIGQQVIAAAGDGDRVPVGIRITGDASSPTVALDLSAARDNVVARARESAEREARAVAARATEVALDRLEIPDSLRGLPADSLRKVIGDSLFELLPDSLRVPPDSVRARAEDALRKRLRGLFGGG